MAAAYINGLQENHVGATVKHFGENTDLVILSCSEVLTCTLVCNDQEDERYSVDTLVPERGRQPSI